MVSYAPAIHLDAQTPGESPDAHRVVDMVPGDVSGGPNTSHTIVISALATLLDAVPRGATQAKYEGAALEGNVLGKQTEGARRRTFRYLRELYPTPP